MKRDSFARMRDGRMSGDVGAVNGRTGGSRKWLACGRDWFLAPQAGEQIYLLSYLIYQVMCMWETTMFPLPFRAELVGKALALAIVAVKILLYDGYSLLKLAGFASLGVCTAFTAYTTRYLPPFVWVVYLAGSRDVSFKKILEIYLTVTVAGMVMAYGASMLGVIENLRYVTEKRGIRNSFGIVYATDFAAHIFYVLLVAFCLAGEKLRPYHYLGAILVAVAVYHFCNARLDSGSILLMVALFWLGNTITGSRHVSQRVKRLWRRGWGAVTPFVMPLCMAVAVGLTYAYGIAGGNPSGVLQKIDKFISSRLRLGWQLIDKYGIHLFGRNVPMIGAGGTVRWPANYSFADCSYVYLLLKGGVLFMAAFLILYAMSCRRNRHDLYFLYAVALISVNSMIAHHLVEPAYNPLLLAAFTACVRGQRCVCDASAEGGMPGQRCVCGVSGVHAMWSQRHACNVESAACMRSQRRACRDGGGNAETVDAGWLMRVQSDVGANCQ